MSIKTTFLRLAGGPAVILLYVPCLVVSVLMAGAITLASPHGAHPEEQTPFLTGVICVLLVAGVCLSMGARYLRGHDSAKSQLPESIWKRVAATIAVLIGLLAAFPIPLLPIGILTLLPAIAAPKHDPCQDPEKVELQASEDAAQVHLSVKVLLEGGKTRVLNADMVCRTERHIPACGQPNTVYSMFNKNFMEFTAAGQAFIARPPPCETALAEAAKSETTTSAKAWETNNAAFNDSPNGMYVTNSMGHRLQGVTDSASMQQNGFQILGAKLSK